MSLSSRTGARRIPSVRTTTSSPGRRQWRMRALTSSSAVTHTLQPVELLTAADGRDVPVYYSLGNFLSHQKEKMNLLGGMAKRHHCQRRGRTHVSEYDLQADRQRHSPQCEHRLVHLPPDASWTATAVILPPRTASPNAPLTPCGRCMRISQDKRAPVSVVEAGACYHLGISPQTAE